MNTRTHPGRTSQIFRNGIPFAQIHVPNLVVGADGDSQLATRNSQLATVIGRVGGAPLSAQPRRLTDYRYLLPLVFSVPFAPYLS